jgi:hypothetical protein
MKFIFETILGGESPFHNRELGFKPKELLNDKITESSQARFVDISPSKAPLFRTGALGSPLFIRIRQQ